MYNAHELFKNAKMESGSRVKKLAEKINSQTKSANRRVNTTSLFLFHNVSVLEVKKLL